MIKNGDSDGLKMTMVDLLQLIGISNKETNVLVIPLGCGHILKKDIKVMISNMIHERSLLIVDCNLKKLGIGDQYLNEEKDALEIFLLFQLRLPAFQEGSAHIQMELAAK